MERLPSDLCKRSVVVIFSHHATAYTYNHKEVDVHISIISQPFTQLGNEITNLLQSNVFQEVRFVSAFVGLRSVLRFKEYLAFQNQNYAEIKFLIGIDLGGTSQDVLSELIQWNAQTYIVHNPIPRSTFHPKFYYFKAHNRAVLFIGSNNWTEGGLYTNYEVCTRYDFDLPNDNQYLADLMKPLQPYFNLARPDVAQLTPELIQTLSARGMIVNEAEARRRRNQSIATPNELDTPPNPFPPVPITMPPNLPSSILNTEQRIAPFTPQMTHQYNQSILPPVPSGALVWQKVLSASEALQISNEGTNPVGGIRLTQARFADANGRIDQTRYFRNLFADYHWEPEIGRNRNSTQEFATVPMRVIIRGIDYGVQTFEVSHKPDGEAGQNNYTTIIRWGRFFMERIPSLHLTGATLSLYATSSLEVGFLMVIA
ncbi:phospholipase D family protein [Alcaligenes faecalis]|uniref:phospholipase D family protein n=1 Tax=Alcaligenes faecalis TaxID=511 RepID=UPI002933D674|nr:phospholipase D family protein [Alcaligenes faecalis]MDV2117951.1 phospholipase D family protein [Alcaligenes faecalis]